MVRIKFEMDLGELSEIINWDKNKMECEFRKIHCLVYKELIKQVPKEES